MIGYAHDWVIHTNHRLPRTAEIKLKKATNKSMLIHRRRLRIEFGPKLRTWIGNEQMQMSKHLRILGLTFDEQLNWKEHTKEVKAKAS
jgi:hypothetical protein